MRRTVLASLISVVAVAPPVANAATGNSCHSALPPGPTGLPGRLLITTGCGTYRLDQAGILRRAPRPTEERSAWTIGRRRGHLVLTEHGKVVWRSHGTFERPASDLYGLALDSRNIAFSYPHGPLWIARFGRGEHSLGRYEAPLGWTTSHLLLTARFRGDGTGALFARREDGSARRVLATRELRETFDEATRTVLYVTSGGDLDRTDGTHTAVLARISPYRIDLASAWLLLPGRGLISLSDTRHLVVFRADGSLYGSTTLDHSRGPVWIVPGDGGVAFTVVEPSKTLPTSVVWLLRSGESRAAAVYRAENFAPGCGMGWDDLSWSGSWLLYWNTAAEAVVLDAADPTRRWDLTAFVRVLPGVTPPDPAPAMSGLTLLAWS